MSTRIGRLIQINESMSDVNESDASLNINGVNYDISFIKGGDSYNGINYSLVLKSKDKILGFPEVFTYEGGQSQGSSRTKSENFLNVLGYGGSGNGSGVRGTPKPYLSSRIISFLEDAISGKPHNAQTVKLYKDIKQEFSPKAKSTELKAALVR